MLGPDARTIEDDRPDLHREHGGRDERGRAAVRRPRSVEARRGGELYGEERLVETLVANAERSAQEIAEAIGASALAFQNGVARDDIVVIVWKRTTTFGRDE